MSDNKRDSSRVGLVIDIRLMTDDNQEYVLKSQNISDTGVFLEYGDTALTLPIGETVTLQVCGMLADEAPPPVRAEIRRLTKEGMGLKFIL